MVKEVKLFINEQEVEFEASPDILFTFQIDELTNPTVVKNSYSKTLSIPGTKQNNKIFDSIWNVERVQDILTFNPSKKAPFVIYYNSDIYQTGYVKLLDIQTDKHKIVYNVSLFGGLGDFFYSLMYSSSDDVGESEKKKLSDLYFGTNATATTSADEFDFQINKDTVLNAWSQLSASTPGSMWNTINFAPLYNGLPDGFDSNKVVINTSGNSKILRSQKVEGTTYTQYENYVLAELKNNYTEWQMRDLRSYLQRPVIRVKDIIGAICRPENNGGYEVVLDEEFFSSGNPYYWKSWMTLPMLSNIDFETTKESISGTASLGSRTSTLESGYKYVEKEDINISGMPDDAKSYNVSVDVDIQAILNSSYLSNITTSSGLNITAYDNYGTNYPAGIAAQLVAYDSNGRVCGGSQNVWITAVYQRRRAGGIRQGQGREELIIPSMTDLNFKPVYSGANSTQLISSFEYVGNNKKTWHLTSGVSLTIKNVKKAWNVKLVLSKVNASPSAKNDTSIAKALFQASYTNDEHVLYKKTLMDNFNVILNNYEVTFNTNESIRSGSKFKKAQLLNTDYTPADWLLSYAKQFGLYFSKDKSDNKIYIRTRKSFYDASDIIDLDKLIDNSKKKTINPIVFDAKWYNWQLEQEKSTFSQAYQDTYGLRYGAQKVNTGYNFDGNDNDLLKGNIFKGAIECLERSDMYTYISGDTTEKPWQLNGYTYNLYSTTDMEDTTEVTVPATTRFNKLKSFQSLKFYDLFSKVQLHDDDNKPSDGSKILLFFDTFVPTKSKSSGDDIHYWLSDDNNAMAVLNEDTPCWYYTVTSTTDATLLTSIPHFGRYLINDGENIITSSWDFGNTRQLYIPDVYTSQNSTIYSQYWKRYITDLYDIDTKKLTCYVQFKGKPTEEWLRYFYWFNNSIWRINKIIDHNVTSNDTTKVEFVKVQDITNYTVDDYQPLTDLRITFGSGATSTRIENSGGTVRVYVTVGDQSTVWYVGDSIASYASVASGTGNGYFDVTIPANTEDSANVFYVCLSTDVNTWSNTITITQGQNVLNAAFQQPWGSRNIFTTGETAVLTINSTHPWTISVDSNFVTLSSSAGTGEPVFGETINVTWSASDEMTLRNAKFTLTDSVGNVLYVYKNQNGLTSEGLYYQNSGGTKIVYYSSGKSWVTPDWITVTDNGDDTYSVEAVPNTKAERAGTIAFQGDDGVEIYYVDAEQEAGGAELGEFDITPKVWFYDYTGGTQVLYIINPSGKTWEFHNVPNWITIQYSGTSEGNINAVAAPSSSPNIKENVIIFYNRTDDETIALYCKEDASPIALTAITVNEITWVTDIPASGGVATSANCSYRVTGYYIDGTTGDVSNVVTVSGSLPVNESTDLNRHSAGTLTLTFTHGECSDSGSVTAYQAAFVPYLNITPAAITLNSQGGVATFNVESNIDWWLKLSGETIITGISITGITVIDAPASGGTITASDCTYTVLLGYDDGTQIDVTSQSVVSGSLVVPPSDDYHRHSAGTLTLNAEYSGYTGSANVVVYQEAYPNYLQFNIESAGTIVFSRSQNAAPSNAVQYSKDYGNSWTTITATTDGVSISVNAGEKVMFRGDNSRYSTSTSYYDSFSKSTARYNIEGNMMSLIDSTNFDSLTSLSNGYTFNSMFYGCTGLTSSEKLLLPATTLQEDCYAHMFQGCINMTKTTSILPATSMPVSCYDNMFQNCYSLTTAPDIMAESSVSNIGSPAGNMFNGCTSLTYIKCMFNGNVGGLVPPFNDWVVGVGSTGTFVKNPNMTGWSFGDDGIPNGWTIIDAS